MTIATQRPEGAESRGDGIREQAAAVKNPRPSTATSREAFAKKWGDMQPREKMLSSPDASVLTPEDLLAILLRTGSRGCDVMELSRRMLYDVYGGDLSRFGSDDWRTRKGRIAEYNAAHPDRKVSGVGTVKLLTLAAAAELMKRCSRGNARDFTKICLKGDVAGKAAELFMEKAAGEEQENFFVLPLDSGLHPLCGPIRVTRGTATRTPVHPREVFREAIRWSAHSIIVAHNHPNGDPTPSEADIGLTRQLVEVAQIHAIPLLDHIVLGAPGNDPSGKGYVSIFSEHNKRDGL